MATKKTVVTEKTGRNLVNKIVKSVDDSGKRAKKQSKDWGVVGVETSPLTSSPEYVSREAFDAHMVDMSNAIENRMEQVGNRFDMQESIINSCTQYQGWLVSPVLWKRSLAVYGHALLVHMAVVGFTLLIVLLIGA